MEIVIRLNEEDLKDNVVLNMVNNLFKQNKVSSTPLNKEKQVEGRIKKKIEVYEKETNNLVGTYTSAYQIAKVFNIDKGSVRKCLNGERKSYKGYTFKLVG